MSNIPNDEIWYTTWYNKLLKTETLNSNVEVLSNTYSNGKGVIKFNGNITSIKINNRILKSIELPNSVTSIGSGAFSGCSGLTSVTIPDSVTSIETSAFQYCSGLTSIEIPNSVTSIGTYAFGGCSSLTSVTIGNSVTSIGGYSFQGCSGLASVTVPNSVTSIGSDAFYAIRNVNYNGSANGSPWGAKCVNGYVEDGLVYTDNTKTTLVSVSTSLTSVTIPDSVTSIGNNAFQGCTGLTSVIIPDSVENIGSNAFNYCTSLTSVNIPDSVENIGSNTFNYCTNLTSITIPDSVTTIENGAFQGCSGLTSVTIPDSVTSIGNSAFSGCSGLTSVTIGNFVTSIGNGAFGGCSSLTSVTIPDSVTTIGTYAFYNCTSLTSVTIPNSVESIKDYVFQNCTNLTSVTIPDSVTSIGNSAFSGCSGLTSVTVPNSVTSIGSNAFNSVRNVNYNGSVPINHWGAKYVNGYVENGLVYTDNTKTTLVSVDASLTSVTIPNSVKDIGSNAFYNCKNLTSVTIPNSVKSVGFNTFQGCTGLTSVTIPNSVKDIGSYTFSDCSGLTSITIPDSVTSIGYYAFNECTSLTSITIPNSVINIEPYAFHNCTGLTSVTIPGLVKSIKGNVFRGCIGLTSVTIPNSVTSIGTYAFGDCKNLTSVTIPNSVTSIGTYAFYNCKNLTSVTIGNSVTSIEGNVFQNCYSLTSVTVPNSVTSIGSNAFYGVGNVNYNGSANGSPWGAKCVNGYVENGLVYTDNTKTTLVSVDNSLTSVTIPDSVESIGSNAFYNCTNLTSVTIGNSVTSIGTYAFYGCNGLTSVTIGDSVTNIGNSAFQGCSGLTSITIPDSVTSIGSNAFYAIRNVNYNGSANGSPWGAKCVNGYIEDGLVYTDNTKTTLVSVDASLTSVTIPDTVNMVYDGVFYYNDKLQSIVIPKSEIIDSSDFSGKVFNELDSPLSSITILDQNPNDVHLSDLYVDNIYVPQNCLKLYEYLYKDNEFMLSKLRAIPLNIRFRKKEYNESEDNESGVIIFDESKKTIYLDGVDYTQTVIDASKLSGEIPSECYKDSTLSGVAYCSTAAATAAKKATMPGFELVTGQRIFLQTTNTNSATSNVTLSVNGTEPKPIKIGTATPTTSNFPASWWIANYDGTNWVLTRIYLSDTNTTQTYASASGYTYWRPLVIGYNAGSEGFTPKSTTSTTYTFSTLTCQPSSGTIRARHFKVIGGTSSQFLKADGSVDDNTYSTSDHTHSDYVDLSSAQTISGVKTFSSGFNMNTDTSWTSSDRTIPFGANDDAIKIQYVSDDTNKGLTFNPSTGALKAASFVKRDGTSSQFLKADGSVDDNTYSKSSLTQTKNYTSNSAFYTNGSFTYFNSSDYMTSISSVNNSYTLVEFDDTSVTTTGTSINIPFNFPTVSGDLVGNENIHHFLLKNISNSNITLTLVPPIIQSVCIIGNLTPITLQANNSIEISTKVMNDNWIISKSIEMPITQKPKNVIYYTTSDGNVADIDESVDYSGANIVSNDYENGVGIITFDNDVTSIGDSAFTDCDNFTSVTIPDSVTNIGEEAFYGCRNLTSITIPDSVTSIGIRAFSDCRGLTSITIPNSVTSIGNSAFSNCRGLTSVTIGNSVTNIGNNAFDNCSSFTSIEIPNSVTSIGSDVFYGCTGLTSIIVSDGNTVYDSRNNCNAIIETSTNTLITGCKNTIIPNSVTSIGDSTFSNCTGLTSITIPDNVTSIGNYAFSNCTGLTSVTIPNSVTSIGNSAFHGCSGLTSITSLRTTPPTISILTLPTHTTYIIYVPTGSVETYKAAQYWKNKASQIQAIQQ